MGNHIAKIKRNAKARPVAAAVEAHTAKLARGDDDDQQRSFERLHSHGVTTRSAATAPAAPLSLAPLGEPPSA